MRLLHLTADFPPALWSGIGRAVAARAGAQHQLGHGVTVLDASGQRPPAAPGPRVVPLNARRCPVDPGAFDILHLHSLPLAGLALEMRRRSGRPLVYTAHSTLAAELPPGPLRRAWQPVQEQLFQTADAVIFLNRTELDAATARFPRLRTRGHVVPHGLLDTRPAANTAPHSCHSRERPTFVGKGNPSRRKPVDPRFRGDDRRGSRAESDLHGAFQQNRASGNPSSPFFLFAGRFTRNKGADIVAELVERLAPAGVRFVIAGGHGDPDVTATLKTVARHHPRHCRLTGWLDTTALSALLRRAAVAIMPSRYEPFGFFALEALAAGMPLLASPAGGLLEIVVADSGGEIVPFVAADSWQNALTALLADPARRACLSTQGPRHVTRHFDARRLAQRLCNEVYRPLLSIAAPRRTASAFRPAL